MSRNKIRIIKAASVAMCSIMVCYGIGSIANAATNSNQTTATETTEEAKKTAISTNESADCAKDEMVYVLTAADGSVHKIIVSDWLKNAAASTSISDVSNLLNVVNVKGNEAFSKDESNYVWQADGNDIYYEGETDQEVPVDVSISYKLDGKSITPEELAGKSGKVTIRFDYKNNQYENVEVNGTSKKMYVPFFMLTGFLMDNDHFTNVEVTNGRIVNDGDHSVVIGFAFPGLSENLEVDEEKFTIPDYVEVTADATEFELATTLTVATNELFGELNLEDVDDMDDLKSTMNDFTDAFTKLEDGSETLYENLAILQEKTGDLGDGVDQLADGAKQLSSGANSLKDGVGTLSYGISDLSGGLDTLAENNDTLNAGAKQVFDTLLKTANDQLKAAGQKIDTLTIDNYAKLLEKVIASYDDASIEKLANATAKEQVEAAVKEKESYIKSQVELAVKETVTTAVLQAAGYNMTASDYAQAVKAGKLKEDVQATVTAMVDKQMATKDVKAQIEQATAAQMNSVVEEQLKSEEVTKQIKEGIQTAKAGRETLKSLKSQLDSYNQFYQGLATYTEGVQTASYGAKQLKDGVGQLSSGADTLASGAATLKEGLVTLQNSVGKLVDGVNQLADGSGKLKDGMTQFDEEGIQKLVGLVGDDVDGFMERVKTSVDIAKNYKSFSGISNEMDGRVTFLYKSDAIETK